MLQNESALLGASYEGSEIYHLNLMQHFFAEKFNSFQYTASIQFFLTAMRLFHVSEQYDKV